MGDYPSYPYPSGALDGSELLLVYRNGENEKVPGYLFSNRKGDPGGNAMAIGTMLQASSIIIPVGTDVVCVSGHYNIGDDGAGTQFVRDATVDAAYVAAHPLSSFLDAASHGFRRFVPDQKPNDMAADGVASDRAAFLAQPSGITLPRGTYTFDADTNIDVSVDGRPGMTFRTTNGAKLAFRAGFKGSLDKLFDDAANIDLSLARLHTGVTYPEWSGAVAGGGDCLAAQQLANARHPRTEWQARDYYFSDTPTFYGHRRKVRGQGIHWGGDDGSATRFIVRSDSSYGVVMGLAAPPLNGDGSLNTNLLALDALFENIEVVRDRAPRIAAQPVGVMCQYAQDPVIRRVKAQEHMIAVALLSTINEIVEDCRLYRTIPGIGDGVDFFHAVRLITGAHPISAINGNASSYIARIIAACAAGLPGTVGLYLGDRFCDTLVNGFETAGLRIGALLQGDAATANGSATPVRTNSNTRLTGLVVDQFADAGLRIDGLNKFSAVRVSDFYAGPSPGALAAVHVRNSQGAISFSGGGELAMAAAPGARGFLLEGSIANPVRKVSIDRSIAIMECGYRAIDYAYGYNLDLRATISNEVTRLEQAVLGSGGGAANEIAVAVAGGTGKVNVGVQLEGPNHTRTTVNVSGLDRACIDNSLGNNRLIAWNPAANGGVGAMQNVTAPGTFGDGTNLVEGNFG